jgi:hypothetical protein
MMHSLFFHRETGRLVKAVSTSQEGCGIVFQRWDARERRLSFDSYWKGEGVGGTDLPKRGRAFFADEVAFLGGMLEDKAAVVVHPPLLRNRVNGVAGERRTVARAGRICRLEDAEGRMVAEYAYDDEGFLEQWEIPGLQEFRRVSRVRLYYWEFTKPGDERRLEGE